MHISLRVLAPILLASIATAQRVVYVDAAAAGANTGRSWTDAFPDLQDALAVTAPGDEVWVAGGTYHPDAAGDRNRSFALQTGVALLGGFAGTETSRAQRDVAANPTILSGDLDRNDTFGSGLSWYVGATGYAGNSVHVVTAGAVDNTAVLDGFVVENGWAVSSSAGSARGAGLVVTAGSPTVQDCTFRHHVATWQGAAVAVVGGAPILRRCRFVENAVSDGKGGGLISTGTAHPLIEDCEFRANTSRGGAGWGAGGGAFVDTDSQATFRGCRFVGNEGRNFYAQGQIAGCFGGGLANFASGTLVEDCAFVGNRAHAGGGIHTWHPIQIRDCLFDGNSVQSYPLSPVANAGGYGGGVGSNARGTNAVEITNSTFVHNHASDEGGGIAVIGTAPAAIRNSIFWGDTDSRGNIGLSEISGARAAYCCVQNLWVPEPGEDPVDPSDYPGCFDTAPRFVDADGANNAPGDEDDDLRLRSNSPCVDAGDPAITTGGLDVARTPRRLDGDLDGAIRTDIGAHEFANLRLDVTVTPATLGTAQVTIDVDAAAGLTTFLVVGLPGAEIALPPIGSLFIDAGAAPLVALLGAAPVHLAVQTSTSGAELSAQAIGLAPSGAGNTSNVVRLRL